LLGIINEILDFSKIEAGKLEIECAPFRLGTLLNKIAVLGSAAIGHKPIEFVIGAVPVGAEYLNGDALRLEQVLINLVGNAAKFTAHGEIKLEVAIAETGTDGLTLRFSVRDTGIGIDTELQQHIFTPFSQADSSTTRRFGGTGLGLSICQRLVALMGGEIGVQSTPGMGSEFWFNVRLQTAVPENQPLYKPAKQHVLVVDDHPAAREVLSSIVRSLGWEVEVEASGAAAAQHFAHVQTTEHPFDIVLMDWQMPGLDGLAASRAIRQTQTGGHSPIIIMVTAYERERLLTAAGAQNVDGILSKPVTASSLYDAITQIQKSQKPAMAVSSPANSPQRLAGWRVLVTDDNEINRDVAQLQLESEGAAVYLATDGKEALDWLDAHPDAVDVVLMDVQMPVMDGYEAARRLRQKPAFRSLPIVALTAGVFKEHQEAALAAGMNGFIGKPFDPNEMVDLLLRIANQPQQLLPTSRPQPAPTETTQPSLAVMDVAKALRVWRVAEKYQTYLRHFVEFHGRDGETIAELVAKGDLAAAAAAVHKLKGGAGNLALLQVERQALQVEKALREGVAGMETLHALTAAIAEAVQAIESYTAQPTGQSGLAQPVDASVLAPWLLRLLPTLDQYSPDEAESILANMADKLPDENLRPIIKAVQDFDFHRAKTLVLELVRALGIQPDSI
jgi:hypothetical protein